MGRPLSFIVFYFSTYFMLSEIHVCFSPHISAFSMGAVLGGPTVACMKQLSGLGVLLSGKAFA
jgi:hypothetical protein